MATLPRVPRLTVGVTPKKDPFFNPGQFKQGTTDWLGTPAISGPSGFLEENQDAAFTRALGALGVGLNDTTPWANYMKEQFRNTQTGFKAALAERPTLTYQDYLKETMGNDAARNLRIQYDAMGPRARGYYPEQFGGAMRTIADL